MRRLSVLMTHHTQPLPLCIGLSDVVSDSPPFHVCPLLSISDSIMRSIIHLLLNVSQLRSNQEQILLIEEELRGRGLTTCVDKSSQPPSCTPESSAAMNRNIDECDSILIFVTSKFMSKVNGMDGNNDVCKLEYDYALKSASSKLVIVILEERMRIISQWKGALRCVFSAY